MDDLPGSDSVPVEPPLIFVAHRMRWRGLVGLVTAVALCGLALTATTGDKGQTNYVLLGLGGILALAHFIMLFNPSRVRVTAETFEILPPVNARTPRSNVRTLAYHGNGMMITFADLDQVEASNQKLREAWLKCRLQNGYHLILPGFTLEQVEQIRTTVGLTAPDPAEQAGEIEAFYRTLFAATPHVGVTWVLLAVCIVVFAVMAAQEQTLGPPSHQTLLRFGSNFGPLTTHGEWWRMVSCAFVHIGLLHLLMNMWVLTDIGPLMERLLGSIGFLLLYLFSAIAGSAASLAWHPAVISAGASGAIFGLFGALLGLMLLARGSIPTVVVRDLRASGFGFFAYNFLYGLSAANLDQAGHIGGAVAGFVGGLILARRLTADNRPGRTVRNLALAGVGGAGIVLAITLLPPTDQSHHRFLLAIDDLPGMEDRAIKTYNAAIKRRNQGELTDQQFADVLRDEVLPPWRAFRERLAGINSVPPGMEKEWPLYREYLQTRQECWELWEQALRTGDPQFSEAATRKSERVEQILRQLNERRDAR
jgi:rhomboid protease GluP